jgi:peptidoglycan/xylan/chitin deacetylase (PgdA/CDA1 family)
MAKNLIRCGASRVAEALRLGGATCLLYHRILPDSEINPEYYFAGLSVSMGSFEQHLDYLRSKMQPRRVRELFSRDTKANPKAVGVSLDDGYLDNALYALPLLEKYEIPATIFVTPRLSKEPSLMWWFELEQRIHNSSGGAIEHGTQSIAWDHTPQTKRRAVQQLDVICKTANPAKLRELLDQLPELENIAYPTMLNEEQLRELAQHPLIDIGAHALSHHALAQLSYEQAKEEIAGGLEELTRITGTKPILFAYPYGGPREVSQRDVEIAATLFEACYTTMPGHICQQTPSSYLPRINIDLTDTLSHLRWKLSGGYSLKSR